VEKGLIIALYSRVEPTFEENSVNNTLTVARVGQTVSLHCRIFMIQVN
jgi:hypothetical protein